MTEDQMVGWHHQLNEHEFEQALGDGEGQGSLVCYSPWDCKELETTERLNNNNRKTMPLASLSWDEDRKRCPLSYCVSLKNPAANAGGDMDSTPGSGRSPGRGHRNPLQYSCLENPMDRGAWQAAVHGVTKEFNIT